jgi:apolipoprotein N-acyltransferase
MITRASSSTGKYSRHTIFMALFSGILLFLSFPKFGFGLVAWVALIPLFVALKDTLTLKKAFFLGWSTGCVAYVGVLYWIVSVIVNYGRMPVYLGIACMLLLVCYLSIYVGLFGAGIVYLRNKVPLFLAAPFLWVATEYLKSTVITGFPWENLGYSQVNNFYLIQIADITGVAGLSFLIVLFNASIFNLLNERSKKTIVLASCVCLLSAGIYAYGIIRVGEVKEAMRNVPQVSVTLAQGNIDQSVKWSPTFQEETIDIYEGLSLKDDYRPGGLIIWPETAVPFNFELENALRRRVKDIAARSGKWLVFGAVSFNPHKQNTDFFNSAYLLSPDGEIRGRYDKVHLVPYGEYVPLRNVFPFISSLTAGIGDFARGAGYHPLDMGKEKIGVLICYEGILPEAGRAYKSNGAALLVNITNDAWFGKTSAPYQHLSMSVFRAVETRLYLARAANTGVSAIVDPCGEIIDRTEIFKKGVINGKIQYIDLPSFYVRHGEWLVVLSFIVLAVFVIFNVARRRRYVRRKHTR